MLPSSPDVGTRDGIDLADGTLTGALIETSTDQMYDIRIRGSLCVELVAGATSCCQANIGGHSPLR